MKASPCPCGHKSCKAWHVEPVAAVQGVNFTQAQAKAVAQLLSIKPDGHFHTPASAAEIWNWIERQPKDAKPYLYTAAMMVWNLFAPKEPEPNHIPDPDGRGGTFTKT